MYKNIYQNKYIEKIYILNILISRILETNISHANKCSEEAPEEGDTRCHTISPEEANWDITPNDPARHDFNVGGCFFVSKISQQLDALLNGKLGGGKIKWVSPCFAYTDSKPHKIKVYPRGNTF